MYHTSSENAKDEITEATSKNNPAMYELNLVLKENIDLLETDIPAKLKQLKAGEEYQVIRDQLENEHEKQFVLQKELIEQEIKQVSERQKLFIRAMNQQSHHCQLIQQEVKLANTKYSNQINQNKTIQKAKKQNLEDINNDRITTQNELKELEQTHNDIEENNEKELTDGKEKLATLDELQEVFKKDIKKVIKQQDRKKQRLDKLSQQLSQAEQELENLVEDELQLFNKEKSITNEKSQVRSDIEAQLAKQQQTRDENSQLEETKFQNLKHLKKQYYSTQQEILHLEHEEQNLLQDKQESESATQRDLEELQKQRKIKQNVLDILDLELHQKDSALQKLIGLQKSLDTNSDTQKDLQELETDITD